MFRIVNFHNWCCFISHFVFPASIDVEHRKVEYLNGKHCRVMWWKDSTSDIRFGRVHWPSNASHHRRCNQRRDFIISDSAIGGWWSKNDWFYATRCLGNNEQIVGKSLAFLWICYETWATSVVSPIQRKPQRRKQKQSFTHSSFRRTWFTSRR